jgi:hypothetical protein
MGLLSDRSKKAWDNPRIVGFARCMTDFVFNDQINTVIVDEEYENSNSVTYKRKKEIHETN